MIKIFRLPELDIDNFTHADRMSCFGALSVLLSQPSWWYIAIWTSEQSLHDW